MNVTSDIARVQVVLLMINVDNAVIGSNAPYINDDNE